MTGYGAEKNVGVGQLGIWTHSTCLLEKSMQRIVLLPSWAGIASVLKVLRSLAAIVQIRYMSVMSTQRVEEMSHLSAIGYLSIGETPLEAWRPDVAFNQIEVKQL